MARQDRGAALAGSMAAWIDRLCPDADRAAALRAALGAFEDAPVTEETCTAIERACRPVSRHIELQFDTSGALVPDREPPGWPPQDAAEVRARAGSVGCVSRGGDGLGVLALDGLDTLHLAAPFLEAAFGLLRGCRRFVLDLRANGGGDPATLTRVIEWLAGSEPVHVSDVVYKDRVKQWWTAGRPAGDSLGAVAPVAVLVSARTYSSGEALAYHARSVRGAVVVGEATPGAADHVTPVVLTPHVRALLPEARVRDARTGTNWEGTGVVPDVACPAGDALGAAVDLLSRGDPTRR
jgi:Peptidase family S41